MEQRSAAITLLDVAEAAGVGESTASRVLRDQGSFSEKTRARVMAAVETLGYVPNRIAGSLASTGSPLVAIVVPSLSNIVFADLLSGVTQALEEGRRQAVFAVSEYDPVREEALVAAMLAWRPAAVMLAGLEHGEATRRMLRAAGCRIAELLDIDGTPQDLAVGFSNRAAGRVSAVHLVQRGYQRIGYVGHDTTQDTRAGKRLAGFRETLAEAGLASPAEEIRAVRSSVGEGRSGLAALMARRPDLQAVYFSNDDMALGGYFHCLEAGISIPSQLAIMGFNGLDIARYTPQPLTTIETPRVEIGRIAAKLILDDAARQTIDCGFRLVAGATV